MSRPSLPGSRMPSRADRHIVIVGPMGAGKTTLGRLLASIMDRPFIDSDEWIMDHLGRSGRGIAASEWVPALHLIEGNALDTALASERGAVVAAAASVVDHRRSRQLLSSVFCVYLTASPEILDRRLAPGAHRREVGEGEGLERRTPLFEEVADLVIDTGLLSESAALGRVLAAIDVQGGSACCLAATQVTEEPSRHHMGTAELGHFQPGQLNLNDQPTDTHRNNPPPHETRHWPDPAQLLGMSRDMC